MSMALLGRGGAQDIGNWERGTGRGQAVQICSQSVLMVLVQHFPAKKTAWSSEVLEEIPHFPWRSCVIPDSGARSRDPATPPPSFLPARGFGDLIAAFQPREKLP